MSRQGIITQLRQLRESRDFSRPEVARKMEKSVRVFEKIERGEQEPKISEAKALAEIYNISLDDISLACFNKLSKDKLLKLKNVTKPTQI